MSIKLDQPKPKNSRRAGVRPRSRFRVLHRMQAARQPDLRSRPLSIRRGQVWTSVVRMARDARAEQYRATILAPLEAQRRENLAVLADPDESPMAHHIAQSNLAHINGEIARRVPDAPAAAARFEAPLVRDKRTAKPNKYANAPAGTRAAHKRTYPMDRREDGCWLLARTAKTAQREDIQRIRRDLRAEGVNTSRVGVHRHENAWAVVCLNDRDNWCTRI